MTRPISEIAESLGLKPEEWNPYGHDAAKLSPAAMRRIDKPERRGRIVLVSAMTPTPHGEGKTTVSIALGQGMARRGQKVVLALREPSMGPVFGAKGGGAGGGQARLEPFSRINLHFTGDLHAIGAANNLLAAMIDNQLHFRKTPAPEIRQVLWRRAVDMNDRALRRVVTGLGGRTEGVPREAGFDITAASEVMAVLCLASGPADLKARLGRLLVGYDEKGHPVTAGDLGAHGSMAALLHDAWLPNLAQTIEGVPAFVHGGPFANIAHGCNSVMATRAAAALGDLVVTEAGFAFELGGEKFLDLKCRIAGLWPSAVVLVATVRAIKHHGQDRPDALERGLENLWRHVENARGFGFDPVVALNVFAQDTEAELQAVEKACAAKGVAVARCMGFAEGGEGATKLADVVTAAVERYQGEPKHLYALSDPAEEKIRKIAAMYGAAEVAFSADAQRALDAARQNGFGELPICIAKTQSSLSDDPKALGAPRGFKLSVREVRIRAGAGFLLALTGDMVTMPGLPKEPAAYRIDLDENGEPVGVA